MADMARAHEWTLRRLREMAGRLTEQAYLRASAAAGEDDEAHAHWMLVFDRMARGLRLSMALEARLARERRFETAGPGRAITARVAGADAGRTPASSTESAPPCEADHERDDEGLPSTAPLSQQIRQIRTILEGAPEMALELETEPAPRLARAERRALDRQRAERARRSATDRPPDEPWDVLTAADLEDLADLPPWRGAG
jgi:hypothetical protein